MHFGVGVFVTLSLVALGAVLAGFTFRVAVVEARLIRARPGWKFAVLFFPFVAVALWSGYARGSSWQAHLMGYGAGIVLLGFMAVLFRPVLPILLAAGGIASNFLVMGVNGLRMPAPGPCNAGMYTCIDASTRLRWLADVIPLDVQGSQIVSAISVGDLLLTVGFALMAVRIWLPQKQLT